MQCVVVGVSLRDSVAERKVSLRRESVGDMAMIAWPLGECSGVVSMVSILHR